jgi:hypothetical protein
VLFFLGGEGPKCVCNKTNISRMCCHPDRLTAYQTFMCTLKNTASSFLIASSLVLLGRNPTNYIGLPYLSLRFSFYWRWHRNVNLSAISAVVSEGFDRNARRDSVHLLSGTHLSLLFNTLHDIHVRSVYTFWQICLRLYSFSVPSFPSGI